MKRKILTIIFIALVVILSDNILADTSDVKALKDPSIFIKKSNELSQSITTIESDFIQKKHLSFFAEDVSSKGKFYFKKENMLRWEYTSPIKYIMVMNQDKFYVKDNNKVTTFDVKSNKMISEINEIMISCIKGNILKNDGQFKISYYENNSIYLVKLAPLSSKMNEYIQRIELYFGKTNFTLTELWMIERSGDYTKISFRNKKINEKIADEIFSIK